MWELRPTCEYCEIAIPPSAPKALICAYECTCCQTCAQEHLNHIYPNHNAKLVERPSLASSVAVNLLDRTTQAIVM